MIFEGVYMKKFLRESIPRLQMVQSIKLETALDNSCSKLLYTLLGLSSNLRVTHDTCIFIMATVFYSPSSMRTIKQRLLSSRTLDLVKPNRIQTFTVCSTAKSRQGTGETELTAHNTGSIDSPDVIANCSPRSVVVNLHPTIACSSVG